MSDAGRPTKVSTQLAATIAESILRGMTEAEAAEAAGIDRASFFNYMKWGRANKPEFMEFFRMISAAKAKARAGRSIG